MLSKLSKLNINPKLKDILLFKTMLAPVCIQIIFWGFSFLIIISAIISMFRGDVFKGLWALVFGPLGLRLMCEMAILAFSINDNLIEIKKTLAKKVAG